MRFTVTSVAQRWKMWPLKKVRIRIILVKS